MFGPRAVGVGPGLGTSAAASLMDSPGCEAPTISLGDAVASQEMWRFGAKRRRSVDTPGASARLAAMEKVLVVDDDAHIRDVVCFALRRAGYQPLQAANGLSALDAVAREQPSLVILDILMPELDG